MSFAIRRRILPGFPLTIGLTLFYVSLIVLLPLLGLIFKAMTLSPAEFLHTVTAPRALATYRVTLLCALAATIFNAGFGLLLAWVLARYDFPGRRLLDSIVDLPFALPTAVAGLALTGIFATNGWIGSLLVPYDIKIAHALPGIMIAMAFTSVPFVVRTVQPIIQDLEPELEEAGRSLGASDGVIFRGVIFPTIFPSFLAGCALAFARSLGEFGAIIFIAGNRPYETEITALLIFIRLEEYEYGQAAAIAVVVLLAAFLMLLLTNAIQAWHLRYADRQDNS